MLAETEAIQPLLIGPSLAEAIAEARQIVADAKARYPHIATVALFSGGNDSTTMLHLCGDLFDFALHINTGIGIEETREFVRDTCTRWTVPLVEKRTDPAWYRNRVIERGFPGPVAHTVMYHNLKRERLREVRRELKRRRGENVMLLTGERAYESQRRMGYGATVDRQADGFIWVNPIHFLTDWHMWAYRERFSIPRNPVSDRIHKSGECLCGAFAHRRELAEIEMWYPQSAGVIHELERRARLAGHGNAAEWAWASERRNPGMAAPGPMCSSCHLFGTEEPQ